MPQQHPLPISQLIKPSLLPRHRLALPLHAIDMPHADPEVVRRAVRVVHIRLKGSELGTGARDGLHPGEVERAELGVEGVHGGAGCVAGGAGADELGGDLHVAKGVDEVEFLRVGG